MNIILFGFKSCGKTTIGRELARRLNRPFYDTDLLVEKGYGQTLSFREIYVKEGAEGFSKLERKVLEQLKECPSGIISVGGSCVLDEKNKEILSQLGTLIYLKIDKEVLRQRIFSAPLPAFFDPMDPKGSFEKMYGERVARYEAISSHVIDVSNKSEEQIVLELVRLEGVHGE